MSKIKRILAVVMAMAMVMTMSLVSFATEGDTSTASITVNGLTPDDNTNLKIYEVVSFDSATNSWVVADWAKAYVNETSNPYEFNWDELKNNAPDQAGMTTNESSYTFSGLGIGAYMIIASGDSTEYNVMGAATYTYDTDNKLIGPNAVTISAKGQGYTVNKAYSEGNLVTDFAKTGDTINFDITTIFPSYPDGETNRTFTITDTPTGMKVTAVEVFVNNSKVTLGADYTVTQLGVADQAVTVAFTESFIGTVNAHAGQNVTVVVTAVVTDEDAFTNQATSNKNMSSTPVTVTGDVGSITITKKDDKDNVLAGAKFKISLNGTVLSFVKIADGKYILKSDDVQGAAVTEVEATAGTLVLKGLGAGTYSVEETVAPEGYSINSNISDIVLSAGANASHDVAVDVIDTTLAELPATGGIGTTIFTIIGCLIMIGAAFMFFMCRRKNDD